MSVKRGKRYMKVSDLGQRKVSGFPGHRVKRVNGLSIGTN